VIILFELTGQYQIILPLMFAIVLAAGIGNLLTKDTIYTLKLLRRGIDLARTHRLDPIAKLRVRDAMQHVPTPLSSELRLLDAAARFGSSGEQALPVTDASGRYLGIVTLRDIERALRAQAIDESIGALVEHAPTVAPDAPLDEAVETLVHQATPGVPVISPERKLVIGWLTHRDVLKAYRTRLA
jgi:chloride channel protein, CIC family